jgi:hypothetical protein
VTLRDTLGLDAGQVYDQVDKVLDDEDGIIILIGRHQATSYCHGFGLSGCQLELLAFQVERAVRALAQAREPGYRRNVHDEHETSRDYGGHLRL